MELVQDSHRGLCTWLEVSFPTGAPGSKGWTRGGWVLTCSIFRKHLSKPCEWVLPNLHTVAQVIRPRWSCSSGLTNQVRIAPLWELSSPSNGWCLQAFTAQVWPSAKLPGRYTNMGLGVKTCTLGAASTGHPLLQEEHGRRQQFCRLQLQQVKSSTGASQRGYSKRNAGAGKNNPLAQSPASFCAEFWHIL